MGHARQPGEPDRPSGRDAGFDHRAGSENPRRAATYGLGLFQPFEDRHAAWGTLGRGEGRRQRLTACLSFAASPRPRVPASLFPRPRVVLLLLWRAFAEAHSDGRVVAVAQDFDLNGFAGLLILQSVLQIV